MNRTTSQLWGLLSPHRWLLSALTLVALLVVVIEGMGLGVVLVLLNAGGAGGGLLGHRWHAGLAVHLQGLSTGDQIRLAALTLFVVILARGAFQYGQSLLALRLRRQVEGALQFRVFQRFHQLPLTQLQIQRRGDLLAMLSQYPLKVGELALRMGRSVTSVVLFLGYVALALAVSWRLALMSVVLLLVIGRGLRPWIGDRLRQISKRHRELIAEVEQAAGEHLSGMRLIRLFDREAWSQALFSQKIDAAIEYEYRSGSVAGLSKPVFNLLNAVVLCGVLVAGAATLHGAPKAVLGQLALFLIIAFRLLGPVGELNDVQNFAIETGPIMDALFGFLEPAADAAVAPVPGSRPFLGLREGVAFEDVTFCYLPERGPVLQGLSLAIPKGRMTAIVGPSGSGKSTLVSLVTRLYDPAEGRVRVDGVDLREWDAGWKRRTAVASQDIFIFHASVRENLRFARPTATQAEIEAAARLAQAHDFIQALPAGYDTLLQERGQRLSGGQRQRLSLARAFLADAELLILDEATSELDTLSERAIHEALLTQRAGRTILIVAHRLSTIRQADRICVLDHGRLAESGTHEELLAAGGLYARMVNAPEPDAPGGAEA